MKKIVLFILILTSLNLVAELRFYREDLHFSLTDSSFTVDGAYYLRNNSDKELRQALYYPFPQDSLYGIVDTIFCENLTRSDFARVIRWDQEGASIQITIPAQDTTVMRVYYNQNITGGKAEYILETTAAWGKGFEQVHYDLTFNKSIKLISISYMPDDLIETETQYKLIWEKVDFMPLENFVVEFEQKNQIK